MIIEISKRCADSNSYRAARVKSLFNVESGSEFTMQAALPLEGMEWKLGLIVGPSGSGKTSLGQKIFGPEAMVDLHADWPARKPIIDAISPHGRFDEVTAALTSVGLGSVPTWLRPFHVLSNGEKFRAGLARIVCDAPAKVVVDEWTSVIDRQIAKIGSLAFAKAWRRTAGQAVLLSCHYDIVEWLQPDWIFDTSTGAFSGRCLHRRPPFDLEIWETNWRYWRIFEPHHYLKLPPMVCSKCYIGAVNGEPICHLAITPAFHTLPGGAVRACRLVVMPEWQGAGVGLRFLNAVCQRFLDGENRWKRKLPAYFHTSHPGLAAALRRDPRWRQVSANLCGSSKASSMRSLRKSAAKKDGVLAVGTGFGGHFRAVQGFKFEGMPCE